MADGEHLSEQSRHLWLGGATRSYAGTEKTPQGRLFAPTGSYTGDPMRLHPANWMKQPGEGETAAHDDIIAWHGSEESSLPRSDEYEHRHLEPDMFAGGDWNNGEEGEEDFEDFSVDASERPMTDYGSAVGMHFGSLNAAASRAPRPHMHPARIPNASLESPPRGNFATNRPGGSIAAGPYKSGNVIVNQETGERTPDTRWSDQAANFADKATDLVESGRTLAYRNDVEASGSTSYRTAPETARTWSEDVMSASDPQRPGTPASKYGWVDDASFRNRPHPALVHLAEAGYDPRLDPKADLPKGRAPGIQLSMPVSGMDSVTDPDTGKVDWDRAGRKQLPLDHQRAEAGLPTDDQLWELRKPTS